MAAAIILDCDPGHDDAIAILMALGSPEVDLIGITTVGGNQDLDKVTYNARAICEAAPMRPCMPGPAGHWSVRRSTRPGSMGGRGSTAWSSPSRPASSPIGTRSAG